LRKNNNSKNPVPFFHITEKKSHPKKSIPPESREEDAWLSEGQLAQLAETSGGAVPVRPEFSSALVTILGNETRSIARADNRVPPSNFHEGEEYW
jgi:hypothetical protein